MRVLLHLLILQIMHINVVHLEIAHLVPIKGSAKVLNLFKRSLRFSNINLSTFLKTLPNISLIYLPLQRLLSEAVLINLAVMQRILQKFLKSKTVPSRVTLVADLMMFDPITLSSF